MHSNWGAALLALFVTGGTTAQMGCSPCSVHGRTPIEFTSGNTNESLTIYESGEVDGEMLHFPQGRRYDLVHGLGARPKNVDLFLSFRETLDPDGDPDDKTQPNNLAPSAGNQAVIEVWNDEIIRVRNDTCAEFYLRVIATADPDEVAAMSSPGAAGANGE